MIRLEKPIIVEGKYDKITLENLIDALIIPTDGFGIFKNREKCNMIRALAEKNGIIVLTDSDSAGNMIRAHIKNIVGNADIINVYVPRIDGKEKRKAKSGKEGILGVEGMSTDILENAFKKSGVTVKKTDKKAAGLSKNDMFLLGLSGRENSTEKRKALLKHLELPENLSSSAMLDIINTIFTREEFEEVINNWQAEETEN